MEIITRKQAIERGLKRYFTGKSCKYGHVAERRIATRRCLTCDREVTRRRAAEWKRNNPERAAKQQRRWRERHPVSGLLYRARLRAKNNGYPFSLRENDIVIPACCPVLGTPLDISSGRGMSDKDNSPSLDRLIPKKGYVPGNVVVVSHRANRLKNDATLSEMKRILAFYEPLLSGSTN